MERLEVWSQSQQEGQARKLCTCPSHYCLCGMNQHPFNHIYYSLSFSAASGGSEDGLSITPGGHVESGASLYPTTQGTGRRLPVVTTAPPLNVPNHHPLYRNAPQHQALLSPHGQPYYFEDSGGSSSQPGFSTPPSRTPPDDGDKRASDESAESSNMHTTLVMHTLAATSHSNTPVQTTSTTTTGTDVARQRQPGLKQNDEEETTTTTITTTTVITTMQSPGNSDYTAQHEKYIPNDVCIQMSSAS